MAKGDVFVAPEGDDHVHFSSSGLAHDTGREPTQTTGWREKANGTREYVLWTGGRWVTDTERNTARVKARDPDHRYR